MPTGVHRVSVPVYGRCPFDTPWWRHLLPSTRVTRLHRYYSVIRLPRPRLPSSPLRLGPACSLAEENHGSPWLPSRHLVKLEQAFDPGCSRATRRRAAQDVAYGVADHLGALRQEQDFGAQYLHGLGAAQHHWSSLAFVSTHQRGRCRPRCKTRYGAGGYPLPRRDPPPLVTTTLPGRFLHPLVGRRPHRLAIPVR